MSWLLRLLVLAALTYLGLCLVAFFSQRRLLYPAPQGTSKPNFPPLEQVWFETESGAKSTGMWAQAPDSSGGAITVVTFHGNGEDLAQQANLARALLDQGLGVLALEYPGYGPLREQSPSEAGLYEGAAAGLAWLRSQGVPAERTVLLGRSLGTGVAVEMASRGEAGRLVLISPYVSMTRMAKHVMPFLPVGLLLKDRFDNLSKAPGIELPVLAMHGTRDEVIPFAQGEQLAKAFPHARFLRLDDTGHNDIPLVPGSQLIQEIAAFALETGSAPSAPEPEVQTPSDSAPGDQQK